MISASRFSFVQNSDVVNDDGNDNARLENGVFLQQAIPEDAIANAAMIGNPTNAIRGFPTLSVCGDDLSMSRVDEETVLRAVYGDNFRCHVDELQAGCTRMEVDVHRRHPEQGHPLW